MVKHENLVPERQTGVQYYSLKNNCQETIYVNGNELINNNDHNFTQHKTG